MAHGVVDVFAFQEALLLEAVFGIIVLAMIYAGFRRWMGHKESTERLIAEQSAERAAQNRTQMDRIEARLNAVEQIVTEGGGQTAPQIEAVSGTATTDGGP